MVEPKPEPKADDPCPACGGAFAPARVPTPEQLAASRDRENPIALGDKVDTATAEQRAELGALHICGGCGYQTRVKPERKPRRSKADSAPAGDSGE